ncbi:MAG: hypothetical protein IKN47_07565 [Lachnospiraceae bacterium]|nr:hypothetical protein [Lachnospiraceae bacterium]
MQATMLNGIISMLDPGNVVMSNNLLSLSMGRNFASIYQALISKSYYYQSKNMDNKGWFYCTIDDLRESTALAYKAQRHAIDKLIELGLIEYRRMGLPAKRYFRIVTEKVESILSNILDKGREIAEKLNPKVHKQTKESCVDTQSELNDMSDNTLDSVSIETSYTPLSYKIDRHTIREQLLRLCPCDDSDDGFFVKKCLDTTARLLIKRKVNRQTLSIYSFIDDLNHIHADIGLYDFFVQLSSDWIKKADIENIHAMNAYFDSYLYNYVSEYALKKNIQSKDKASELTELDKWLMKDYI